MLYLDTSLLVAFVTNESETSRVQFWVRSKADQRLSISDWTVTEFSSALSVKLRRRDMTVDKRNQALSMFRSGFLDLVTRLGVSAEDFQSAAELADNHALGLRGSDALHLAVAKRHRATLCTLDRKQAEAGAASNVDTLLV